MSAVTSAAQPGASRQAVVEAALVLLERMGLSPADLVAVPRDRPTVPTFRRVHACGVSRSDAWDPDGAAAWAFVGTDRRPAVRQLSRDYVCIRPATKEAVAAAARSALRRGWHHGPVRFES
jgi:hypothetical protein